MGLEKLKSIFAEGAGTNLSQHGGRHGPPHPDDHSKLDDGAGTYIRGSGLQYFTPEKIKSFTYPDNSLPQQFEANGAIVTGKKKLIESRFIDQARENSLDFATSLDDNLGVLGNPQSFEVSNRAGTYTVQGHMGTFELDSLLDKSLIMQTYDTALTEESLGIFFDFRSFNTTYGFRQTPFDFRDFGRHALDEKPKRFGGMDGPLIGPWNGVSRGGIWTNDIVDSHLRIHAARDTLGDFILRQTVLQNDAIMRGDDSMFALPGGFQQFNGLQFYQNFEPGVRIYRHGFPFMELPRYSTHVPFIGKGLLGDDHMDPTSATSDDFSNTPKLLYLYNNFMLTDPITIGSWNFSDWIIGMWDDTMNPYPIAPSINVTKSIPITNKNRVYTENIRYGEFGPAAELQTGATGLGSLLELVGMDGANKFKFFSKFKTTKFNLTPPIVDGIAGDGVHAADNAQMEHFNLRNLSNAPISQKMKKNAIFDTQKVPLAVGGKDSDWGGIDINLNRQGHYLTEREWAVTDEGESISKHSTLAYNALGIDKKSTPMGADSTMYDETLRSPSELNIGLKAKMGGYGETRPDWLKAESGPSGDKIVQNQEGIRDHMQKKVYAIGHHKGGKAWDVQTVKDDKGLLYGAINKSGTGKSYIHDGVDKVNIIPYGNKAGETGTDKEDDPAKQAEKLDFVPLVFKDVYNKKNIVFRAIFNGDITDTVTPDWSEEQFIGRPIKTAMYKGVSRRISFGFQLFPKTKQEFPVLLEKVNYLVGQCYPNLDAFMRQSGPLIQLTLGDILRKQLGYLTELTVTFPSTSPWELDPGLRFTKLINVQCGFAHVGNYVPVSTGKHYGVPWLEGGKYGGGRANFTNFPLRQGSSEAAVNTPNSGDYRQLFQDLGQVD